MRGGPLGERGEVEAGGGGLAQDWTQGVGQQTIMVATIALLQVYVTFLAYSQATNGSIRLNIDEALWYATWGVECRQKLVGNLHRFLLQQL